MNSILEAALSHQHEGRSVIAVNRDKRPYHEGWNKYFTQHQTEEEANQEFINGSDGIALILYPSCALTVLDFDGPHADAAWQSTGLELPDTAENKTRSGGKHLYFIMPPNAPSFKRKVRIVKATCSCKKTCGVDLLINGYALIPPSPGYSENPDHPLESAVLLPAAILDRAVKETAEPAKKTGEGGPENKVYHGEMHATLVSLAGSMKARGMSTEAIRAGLLADYQARFDHPSNPEKIEQIIKSVEQWETNKTPPRLDDIGNGERFVSQYGKETRWSAQLGWLHYDGIRWRDNLDRAIERMGEQTARSIFVEASLVEDKDYSGKIATWAHRSSSMSSVKNMLESAKNKSGMAVNHENLDRDPWLFNLKNGTYNLKTAEFREHRTADLITKYSDVEYSPQAKCPVWTSFIARVIPNHETACYLQKCAGYSLTGSIDEQCFFLLYGTGKNGKSKFLEGIAAVMGDYANVLRSEALMNEKYNNTLGDTAALRGLHFAYAVEPVTNATLNTSFIKQQTGGEKLVGKFLYRDQFSFIPTHKLWIGANHDIKFPDTDEGIKRRVKQIPFKVWIPEEERDPLLGQKFLAELPGILNWILDGLKMFLSESLGMPPEVKEATAAYFGRINPLKDFLSECCDQAAGYRITPKDLFKRYLEWAKEFGIKRPFGRNTFNQHIAELNTNIVRIHGLDYWDGVDLKYLKTNEN